MSKEELEEKRNVERSVRRKRKLKRKKVKKTLVIIRFVLVMMCGLQRMPLVLL